MTQHWRALERMYAGAPVNRSTRPTMQVADGRATVTFQVTGDLCHAAGSLHGAWYFKPLDDAAFFAAASVVPDQFVLTRQFNVHLLGTVTGGQIRAEGRVVHKTRRIVLAESELFDAQGTLVAVGRGELLASRLPWTEARGYDLR